MNLCSNPEEDRFVSCPKLLPVGSAIVLLNAYRGEEEGIKTSEPDADHSPESSSEVGIWLCLFLNLYSTQFVCVPWRRIKHT